VELARSILAGQLFSFHWHDSFWLPVFQFEPMPPVPRAGPRRVLDELHGSLDGWSIANWYVRARDDLCGRRPLDLLDSDLGAVLAAARAERAASAA
jgi:hypothetical protein